jgi:hypothetical protein
MTPQRSDVPSIKALWEAIWEMERTGDLFRRTVRGVFYWPILRARIFTEMSLRYRLMDAHRPATNRTTAQKIAAGLARLPKDPRTLPWPTPGGHDSVIFPYPRKQVRDGHPVDIFSEQIRKDPVFGRFLVLDRIADAALYEESPGWTVRCADFVDAAAQLGRLGPSATRDFGDEHRLLCELARGQGLDFPLSQSAFQSAIRAFSISRALYRRILRRSGARRMFFTMRGTLSGALAAAHDSTISPYQPGYHFPGCPQVPYEPNVLLTFAKGWTDGIDLASNTTPIVMGSQSAARYAAIDTGTKKRIALAVSQGTVGRRLFDEFAAAARACPDWAFKFRPHPLEDATAYRGLIEALKQPNLTLSDGSEDIASLLASCEVIVGVYSTALFEGMTLSARTIVLDLPGAEHMEACIARGDAVLAAGAAELARLLPTAPFAAHRDLYFEAPRPVAEAISQAPVPRIGAW